MEIETMFGLPAHALIVHGAVVLVPLAVIAFIATAWRAEWRPHFALPVAALAVVGWAFAFLAVQSGDPMEQHVRQAAQAAGEPRPQFGAHPDLGETTAWLALAFALATIAYFAADRWLAPRMEQRPWLLRAGYGATSVLGLVALLWLVRTGHSGAKLVWGK